jgi:3',5'-cyclic-AMP phosphodiesterase
MKQKIPIYSDTHFNFTMPWTPGNFASKLLEENPAGLILAGDIACGLTIKQTLKSLAKKLDHIPIYFVVGNHDYYATSIRETTKILKELCATYPNLHWLTDTDHIALTDDVALIGEDGWYDGRLGNPVYLSYNFDWMVIDEFYKLKGAAEKAAYGQKLADDATAYLRVKLERALEKFQTVYVITHMPPWAEATRAVGTEMEDFWLPYNVNSGMGKMIEEVMKDRHNQNVIVLAGHTHVPAIVHVAHNIECIVQPGKYLGAPTEHNCLFI